MQDLTLYELLAQAGWTVVPIYLCSVFAVAIGVRKYLDLRAAQLHDTAWIEPALDRLRRGDYEGASEAAGRSRSPAAAVIRGLVRALAERPEHAEAEAKRVGMEELQRLGRYNRTLALVAEIAPLLGLLGTVVGMVDLFMGIQSSAHGNVEMAQLSSGIWKALLTTAAGLTVAVPTLALHAYFRSQLDRVRAQLTGVVQRFMYVAPGEERARRGARAG